MQYLSITLNKQLIPMGISSWTIGYNIVDHDFCLLDTGIENSRTRSNKY